MPTTSPADHHDPPYDSPVQRSPSPSSSFTTNYAASDSDTSTSDNALSAEAFQRKIDAELRLHLPCEAETLAETRPLMMPKVRRNAQAAEEIAAMFKQVMRSLRWHVEQLEEENVIESAMARSSRNMLETQAAPTDVDAIMHDMMYPPDATTTSISFDLSLGSGPRDVSGGRFFQRDGPRTAGEESGQ
ncbi:hypothetical protein FA95DRAFT_1490212 [Auriscalpium vulgare]|uniref:Uncharacterized protein n=1 Tax=Auriscalpium vulgare TaxID=40419 RepID=A0ACB8RYE1_9AGAM|nr:hypothetical protein FA95DRAFT_1490212 [Auriscalpium vulgare]